MKAVQYNVTIPRYAFGLLAAKLYPPLLWSGISCLGLKEIPEPALPGDEWVKVRTSYGGICGTDLSTVYLHTSTYYEPFSSSPFTLGHENVGVISEVGAAVQNFQPGDRVTVEPTLWCAPRGIDVWCPYCQKGETNRCINIAKGNLSPGLATGACRDTGGSWSPYFLAHQSQLYKIPQQVSDENALLVEPFACGLHAALQHPPKDEERVLILGAGTIGLMMLAALRATGNQAEIIVSARYPFQAEAARRLGADEVLCGGDLYAEIAERSGGELYSPILGKRVLVGGVDWTYECTGKDAALDDALRLTRAGGKVVIVGVPGVAKGIDWTAIFDNELTLHASYIYNHADSWEGETRRTYDIVLEMMAAGQVELGWMVNRKYKLQDFGRALKELSSRGRHEIIKAVFAFEPGT